eukprot:tig00000093_g3441.t1
MIACVDLTSTEVELESTPAPPKHVAAAGVGKSCRQRRTRVARFRAQPFPSQVEAQILGNELPQVAGLAALLNVPQQLQQLQQLLQQGQRAILRQVNKIDNRTRGNGDILPFLDIEDANGNLPPPALRVPNRQALINLSRQQLQQLLAFYGLPVPQDTEARRRAVMICLGLLVTL